MGHEIKIYKYQKTEFYTAEVTSSTADSHLLQQRSGLLWNRLRDV